MTKIRPIRLSDEEWNKLLRKSVEAGYQNRTEYIRAILSDEIATTDTASSTAEPYWRTPPPKPILDTVVSYWPDKWQKKWQLDGYRGNMFYGMIIDTIYEHWILNK